MFKTNPENTAVITRLTAMLEELSIGNTVEYGTLSAAVDREVDGKHRKLLDKARNAAEERLGCIFETVTSVGIKRLSADDCPEVGLACIGSIRRRSRRGNKRLARINTNSMSDSGTRRIIGYRAMLGAIGMIADGRKAMAVAAVADPAHPIPPENILDMFRRKN